MLRCNDTAPSSLGFSRSEGKVSASCMWLLRCVPVGAYPFNPLTAAPALGNAAAIFAAPATTIRVVKPIKA